MKQTLKQFLIDNGYEGTVEGRDKYIDENQSLLLDSVQPALCKNGCEVEPDGYCQHGGKSISLALGII